jgi:hypothetical protein
MAAIAAIALLEGIGASSPLALMLGMVLFIGATALATSVGVNAISASSSDAAGGSREDRSSDLLPGSRLRDWADGSHLGADPEQVISRRAGGRV